jgi:hypothetical protein
LDLEQRWLFLARSYEFSERLTDLTDETKRQVRRSPNARDFLSGENMPSGDAENRPRYWTQWAVDSEAPAHQNLVQPAERGSASSSKERPSASIP